MTRTRAWWAVGGVVALAAIGFLAFGVFGVHTLFIDDEVSEAGPTFASGAAPTEAVPPSTTEPAIAAPSADGPVPPTTVPATTTVPTPVVRTVSTGSFAGVDHPGRGSATLLSDGTQAFVRFEDDFSTDNGPDLFAVAYVGGERIELGRLKGNAGSQNYELPADVDPGAVTKVSVWCKRFDSTFTEATLTVP